MDSGSDGWLTVLVGDVDLDDVVAKSNFASKLHDGLTKIASVSYHQMV